MKIHTALIYLCLIINVSYLYWCIYKKRCTVCCYRRYEASAPCLCTDVRKSYKDYKKVRQQVLIGS